MLYSVKATPDGGCIAAGATTSYGDGFVDGWLLKVNAQGIVEWQKTYGGPVENYLFDVTLLPDGGYLAAGYKGNLEQLNANAWALKVDSAGNPVWEYLFGGYLLNEFWTVLAGPEGDSYLAGNTQAYRIGRTDWVPLIVHLDSAGTCTWEASLDWCTLATIYSLALGKDGSLLFAGEEMNKVENTLFVGKLSTQQKLLWSRNLGRNDWSWPFGIIERSDGAVVVGAAVNVNDPPTIVNQLFNGLITLDKNGNLKSSKLFKTDSDTLEFNRGFTPTQQGGYILAGYLGDYVQSAMPPTLTIRNLDANGDLDGGCMESYHSTPECLPSPYVVIRIPCEQWTCSSTVQNSQGAPTPFGCRAPITAYAVKGEPWYWELQTDLRGCQTAVPTFSWEFGDGSSSTGENPSHVYATTGIYDARYRVQVGGDSCEGTTRVQVLDQPCRVTCSASSVVVSSDGLQVQFDSDVSVTDCSLRPSYRWDFGDGWVSTSSTPLHHYSVPGHYTYSLQIKTTEGIQWSAFDSHDLDLSYPTCAAVCTANVSQPTGYAPQRILFDGGALSPECSEQAIMEWDFENDGVFDVAGNHVEHTYAAPGTYHWVGRVVTPNGVCEKEGTILVCSQRPRITGIAAGGNPYKLTITGEYFHPDMQVFIGGSTGPWTKLKWTPNGLQIKGCGRYFPKDGSVTVIRFRNGDGGEDAVRFCPRPSSS
jgi:PKD repeat protein